MNYYEARTIFVLIDPDDDSIMGLKISSNCLD